MISRENGLIMGESPGLDILLSERSGLFAQLLSISEILENNPGLLTHDLLIDVKIFKLELEKLIPDEWIIERELSGLSDLHLIHNECVNLKSLLNY